MSLNNLQPTPEVSSPEIRDSNLMHKAHGCYLGRAKNGLVVAQAEMVTWRFRHVPDHDRNIVIIEPIEQIAESNADSVPKPREVLQVNSQNQLFLSSDASAMLNEVKWKLDGDLSDVGDTRIQQQGTKRYWSLEKPDPGTEIVIKCECDIAGCECTSVKCGCNHVDGHRTGYPVFETRGNCHVYVFISL